MGLAPAIRLRARSLAAISNRIKAQCSTKAKLSTAASDSPVAEYVTVTQHDDRTATLTMNHPPVNSLSLEMPQALRDAAHSARKKLGNQGTPPVRRRKVSGTAWVGNISEPKNLRSRRGSRISRGVRR